MIITSLFGTREIEFLRIEIFLCFRIMKFIPKFLRLYLFCFSFESSRLGEEPSLHLTTRTDFFIRTVKKEIYSSKKTVIASSSRLLAVYVCLSENCFAEGAYYSVLTIYIKLYGRKFGGVR